MSENTNEIKPVINFLREMTGKSRSICSYLNNPRILDKMNCTEKEKEDLKCTIELIMGVVSTIRSEGFLSIAKYRDKIQNPVGIHIIDLICNQKLYSVDSMAEAILPYLIASDLKGKEFLESVILYECIYFAIRGVEPIVLKYKMYGYIGLLPE